MDFDYLKMAEMCQAAEKKGYIVSLVFFAVRCANAVAHLDQNNLGKPAIEAAKNYALNPNEKTQAAAHDAYVEASKIFKKAWSAGTIGTGYDAYNISKSNCFAINAAAKAALAASNMDGMGYYKSPWFGAYSAAMSAHNALVHEFRAGLSSSLPECLLPNF